MSNENIMISMSENLNSLIRTGQIWAQGFSELSKTFAHMAQAHLEANLAVVKAMTNAKTTQDALDIQKDYVKKSVDSVSADTKILADTTSKFANESMIAANKQSDGAGVNTKHRSM
jgi:phasin family protein